MPKPPRTFWHHSDQYPKGKTFGELLEWHLLYWHTRPEHDPSRKIAQWMSLKTFASDAHSGTIITGGAESHQKSLRNWREGKHLPSQRIIVINICDILFENDPKLKNWRDDLIATYDREIEYKSGSTVRDPEPPETTQDHFAAAARENVALIIRRLVDGFVGRSADLAEIDKFVEDRMAAGPRGLLVITAPPGFGKSALAAYWCTDAGIKPNRFIAKHFCSVSTGKTTTSLEHIYAHLHQQIAESFGLPIDHQSGDLNSIVGLLGGPPPSGAELVVWLDGIDEAEKLVECFLPKKLGERICVIISARANEATIPNYLEPWLTNAMAMSHTPLRYSVLRLPYSDTEKLVEELFKARKLSVPLGLVDRIYRASAEGYALFVRNMTETAITAILEGNAIDLGDAPGSLLSYAESELRRLEKLERWPDLQPIFVLLSINYRATRIDEIAKLTGKHIFPGSLPNSLMRWLNLVEDTKRTEPPLLSFAHPLLATVFGDALGYQRNELVLTIYAEITKNPFSPWLKNILDIFPRILMNLEMLEETERMLTNIDYAGALRYSEIGDDYYMQMFVHLSHLRMRHLKIYKNNELEKREYSVHSRIWRFFPKYLSHPTPLSFKSKWKQLYHNLVVLRRPEYTTEETPSHVSRDGPIISALDYHESVRSTLSLGENGFLLCNADDTLAFLDSSGSQLKILDGHSQSIRGALLLERKTSFLTWSTNQTIQIWNQLGDKGPVLRGHGKEILGAIELKNSAGILSWSEDNTLRLWGMDGLERARLRGHKDFIEGAVMLGDGSFVSWDMSGTLRFWGSTGNKLAVMPGKRGIVECVIPLAGNTTFISWSRGGKYSVINWDTQGRRYEHLHSGDGRFITNGLTLKHSGIFLTWGADCSLQTRNSKGEELAVWHFSSPIQGALAQEDGPNFLCWDQEDILLLQLEGDGKKYSAAMLAEL